ncbi:hypothetical protein KR009_007067 [Drosophila setifemur]|nr:hypothetical protein KR009_007067 [Drosophila setifemur]
MSKRRSPIKVIASQSGNELVQSLSDLLKRCSQEALAKQEQFSLGLSGGSLVQLLTKALKVGDLNTSQWLFFFCDERYVPEDSSDSTYGAYRSEWLTQLPSIRDGQFVKADTSLPLDKCAEDYEARVRTKVGNAGEGVFPQFDLLLLGMGPDGHTCSLFPEQPASLRETNRLVIPIRNSPKPPPERITFTLPLINSARNVAFVVTGAGKAGIVKSVFRELESKFPAAWVNPKNGHLTLIVDAGAGKEIGSLQ